MDDAITAAILAGAVRASTPILFAGLGELIYERSGVLNLGLEGIMLAGALAAVWANHSTGSLYFGAIASMAVGSALMALHAVVCVRLRANQVVTGLALVLLCQGGTAYFGMPWVGRRVVVRVPVPLDGLAEVPILGPLLFQQDAFVLLAFALVFAATLFLYRTRWGVVVRACGENPTAAAAIGVRVRRIRLAAGMVCGALAGLGGAHLSLACAGQWQEDMVAGRGWIALVLVIMSMWRPINLLCVAILFGGLSALQLNLQAYGVSISSHVLGMLPFVATLILLPLSVWLARYRKADFPAALGQPNMGNVCG